MSLDFLSPRATTAAPARSPLLDAALAAGATPEAREGWESAAGFGDTAAEAARCRDAVGFADLSSLAKLELQWPATRSAPAPEAGCAQRLDTGWRCPVRPDRELLLGPAAEAEALSARGHSEGARVCDLTASLAALVLAGPAAPETFARFCALDLRPASLPVGGFRPGSVARTPAFVLREGPSRYLVLFGAAYAEYLWEAVADAAAALGGGPVAAAALPPIAAGEDAADA